ncbi:MAG: C40 family peptidase [Shimia sp.]
MTQDRRLWPATDRVADVALRGQLESVAFVEPVRRAARAPLLDLRVTLDAPGLDRQLLHGWPVDEIEQREGYAFVRSMKDGYCGWVAADGLGSETIATHVVSAPMTLAFAAPDIKTPNPVLLSLGSHVRIRETDGALSQTEGGAWIPTSHLRPVEMHERDPAAVAERLLGTPYLWGGNGAAGIDCSGLVHAAFAACGRMLPGDSDLQREVGNPVPREVIARNDLLFWKGHVALALDAEHIIHANAHHMAVAIEPLTPALSRIAQDTGPLLTIRRVAL